MFFHLLELNFAYFNIFFIDPKDGEFNVRILCLEKHYRKALTNYDKSFLLLQIIGN